MIERNTKIYLSEIDNDNFIYPTLIRFMVLFSVTRLHSRVGCVYYYLDYAQNRVVQYNECAFTM